ncbi:unnamed protein product [Arabis nemorensis]|uniref:PTC1-like winged helix-turn-helix domain-containing protein n=1 Tax=Arabis nemorensis TaxID=586526 RepID=A0A565CV38_9BRAS|nr:unnamed protein product [Arabis nemorensis]
MSDRRSSRIKVNRSDIAGSVKKEPVSLDTQGEDKSENNMVNVKLEMEEGPGFLLTYGIQKRKRLSRGRSLGRKFARFGEKRESGLEDQKNNKQSRLTSRWNTDRFKLAEQSLVDVLKEKGATFETPVSRGELRCLARSKIGDTGLLDHLLKHVDGKVTPGGADRFRRCHNTEGTMEYWLESADLIKIKRESGIPDPSWMPPAWWKIQNASNESSALLREEIEKMKSDIKELASKQKLPDHDDATEKLHKDLITWRAKTDKQIVDISSSLTSTQCMFKELNSWKDKVEQQLVGISNSLKNLQANGSTSFSPAPESWEHILQTANLDDFTGNAFEPWDVDADLIEVLAAPIRPDTYSLPPCKTSLQDDVWFEEQSLPKIEMQKTESRMTKGESRSSNEDKADMTPASSVTPGSSVTAGPRSEIDDPNTHSEETLKELVAWKVKAEQQLTEMSNTILALKGQL